MNYTKQLSDKLTSLRNRVYNSSYENFNNTHSFFFHAINNDLSLLGLLAFEDLEWGDNFYDSWRSSLIEMGDVEINFPSLKDQAVKTFKFVNFMIAKGFTPKMLLDHTGGGGSQLTDRIQYHVENYIDPILQYIADELEKHSAVQYLLERYKFRAEHFFHEHLKAAYLANQGNGEETLDRDLRLFLFDQGVENPFSTPQSASGRADIVSFLHTDDPLVLEVKIYNTAQNYTVNRIASGFSQIVKYADNYNKNVGYLVIFNLDEVDIKIEDSESDQLWPHRINYNNKYYYIVIVNLNNYESASKAGKLTPIKINFTQLLRNTSQGTNS
jgi:hypothetical protein